MQLSVRFRVYKVRSFELQAHAKNRRNVHHELLQRRSFVVELAEFGADTNWSLAVGQRLKKQKKQTRDYWRPLVQKQKWKPVRASGSLN